MSDAMSHTVYIACGGTGGHLYPGMAVAEELQEAGCDVTLLISPKEVDQSAARSNPHLQFATLPAVGLVSMNLPGFLKGFWQSYRTAKKLFAAKPPRAVVAMGGFTSAPPVLAARCYGAASFLHEANSIPGRANRWLAPWVNEVFVHFPTASGRFRGRHVTVAGMPVRPQFQPMDAESCRVTLGLDGRSPLLLVMGGSQGASAINDLMARSIPLLAKRFPQVQYLHLTGPNDEERMRTIYGAHKRRAVVRPFLTEMELAMNAATAAVSRAGASSLAELAVLRLPAVLIPYPIAADNHQFHNAMQFVETGAARMMGQSIATPELLVEALETLLMDEGARQAMREALGRWQKPQAAREVAGRVWSAMTGQELPAKRELEN
jgi:UDP-N-acetylglucosamine--N-acetylmuramyl-(pentapeptide) pyrophosphoryl-undecaprenol N-acetylglucosamine transferase